MLIEILCRISTHKPIRLVNGDPDFMTFFCQLPLTPLLTIDNLCLQNLIITKSIDRLGRNYNMIINEWQDITKVIEADIIVIDFSILDARSEAGNLACKFMNDIVLQILSFVSENERENIRKRQAEGIKIAREKGIHLGRPKFKLPNNFKKVVNNIEAANLLNMSRWTFLKYSKLYR